MPNDLRKEDHVYAESFPEELRLELIEACKDFWALGSMVINRLTQRNSEDSILELIQNLDDIVRRWMTWQEAKKYLEIGEVKKVLERAKRIERINLFKGQVLEYLRNNYRI